MRGFLAGVAAGLMASVVLRQLRRDRYTSQNLDLYYIRRAKNYNETDNWVQFFGYTPRIELRRKTIEHLNLQAGDRVLDIACGAGANFPYILEKIGPTGEIVGVDYSAAMLTEAQSLVDQKGWNNVFLMQHDAATLDLGEQFDAVMCVLGMVVIPDYKSAMAQALKHLKPGGQICIADLCENQNWYMGPANLLMELLDATLITDTTRRPWELLAPEVENYRREDVALGYMYVASGRKPA
jgi:demethylmenaquinone methyltransferase/2-methoxy-6-polyprenyl-1,4-benzoquinol methylase